MPTESFEATDRSFSIRYPIHELFVDFLGGLVPGILFTMALTVAFVEPVRLLIVALSAQGTEPLSPLMSDLVADCLRKTRGTPGMIWLGAFMTWLFLSYEIGHLFFRQNPNVPDRASLRRISGPLEREEKEKRRRERCQAHRCLARQGQADEKGARSAFAMIR